MNVNNIIDQISNTEPEAFEQSAPRRDMLRRLGKGLAATVIPTALASIAEKAAAQSSGAIITILQAALQLERMQSEFYNSGLNILTPFILIPNGQPRVTIQTIADQEENHVTYLRNVLIANGVNPGPMPAYDFTAGGKFSNVFSNYETFLAVGQLLEDLAVRTYKGQVGNLMSDNAILTAALNMHSVAARHSGIIRKMRRDANFSQGVKPWISADLSQITGVDVSDYYIGESNTIQLGQQVMNIQTAPVNIDFNAASEAFDEILTLDDASAIITTFLVP